jgi:hypothetical protein
VLIDLSEQEAALLYQLLMLVPDQPAPIPREQERLREQLCVELKERT